MRGCRGWGRLGGCLVGVRRGGFLRRPAPSGQTGAAKSVGLGRATRRPRPAPPSNPPPPPARAARDWVGEHPGCRRCGVGVSDTLGRWSESGCAFSAGCLTPGGGRCQMGVQVFSLLMAAPDVESGRPSRMPKPVPESVRDTQASARRLGHRDDGPNVPQRYPGVRHPYETLMASLRRHWVSDIPASPICAPASRLAVLGRGWASWTAGQPAQQAEGAWWRA